MSNRPLYGLLLLLLAMLAAATTWLEYAVQTHRLADTAADLHVTDYMIRHFSVSRTNLAGQVIYTLHAEYAEHFLDNDTATLTLPHLVAQDTLQGSVDIRSDTAFVTAKAKQVNFYGHVVMVRDMHDGQGPMTLNTDYLEVFPDDQVLRTTHPVKVMSRTMLMTAGGLQLNERTKLLLLTRRVKGYYERAQH